MVAVDYAALGRIIRRYRKSRGWSQATLAEKAELSANYIGCIERATRVPSVAAIVSLCYALEVSPNCLLYESLPEELFGEALDQRLTLRAPSGVLRNTLSNWLLADLPDESIIGEPVAPRSALSRLQFTLLGEDLPPCAPLLQ